MPRMPVTSTATPVSSAVSRMAHCATVSPSSCLPDRKSTRLNSSHEWISYAVFCLKKKSFEHGGRRDVRVEHRREHRSSRDESSRRESAAVPHAVENDDDSGQDRGRTHLLCPSAPTID